MSTGNGFPKAAHMNFATRMLLERLLGQTAIQCLVDPGIEPATSGTAVQRCYHLTTEALRRAFGFKDEIISMQFLFLHYF